MHLLDAAKSECRLSPVPGTFGHDVYFFILLSDGAFFNAKPPPPSPGPKELWTTTLSYGSGPARPWVNTSRKETAEFNQR